MTGYRTPRGLLARLAGSALVLRPRSFAADALEAMASLSPAAVIDGSCHVPREGPCLVVCNHYSAPGYTTWWTPLAITAAIGGRRAEGADREVHWVITAAWRGTGNGFRDRAVETVTTGVFRRVARVYGFVTMPPMPPRPDEAAARAKSVLKTVRLARSLAKTGGMIGLAPEGRDHAGELGELPPGAGQFIALLVETGLPVLPAGVWQEAGRLRVRFGPVFAPAIPPRRAGRDAAVAGEVRAALATCLPGSHGQGGEA